MPPNISLNPDASPAALRAVRSAPVSFVRTRPYAHPRFASATPDA